MKLKRIMLFVFACGLIVQIGTAQKGKFWLDGTDWVEWGGGNEESALLQRFSFIHGLAQGRDAKRVAISVALKQLGFKIERDFEINKFSMENPYNVVFSGPPLQIIEGVNKAYEDYANLHIPIFAVVVLVSKRIAGEVNEEEFIKGFQRLRSVEWKLD